MLAQELNLPVYIAKGTASTMLNWEMYMDIAVILAAGMGTRMISKIIKVLHPILGKPMVQWSVDVAKLAGFQSVVVVGNQEEAVRKALEESNVSFARQPVALGTGHAVQCALATLEQLNAERVLVFFGDTPLFRPETLTKLKDFHVQNEFDVTFVTSMVDKPGSYGRLIRDENGNALKIVEAANATPEELAVCEVNTGAAMFEMSWLMEHLPRFKTHPPKGEIYLTDALEIAARVQKAGAMILDDASEADGVNNRVDLAKATEVLQRRIVTGHMLNGVTFADPSSVTVEPAVRIAKDTFIERGVILRGNTSLEEDVFIDAYCVLDDTVIDKGGVINSHTHCKGAIISQNAAVGPYARLREGTTIGSGAKVGNFVEMKKTELGDGAKASHLTYLGDAIVGEKANVGAGTITCNYDGFNKHRTTIGAGAFIGSNTALVAPVTIGKGALIAAGSTITKDVEQDAIGVTRSEQKNVSGAAKRFRSKAALMKSRDSE